MNKEDFIPLYLSENYKLAQQFDEEKNKIKPSELYISSFYDAKSYHWKCPNCNEEWQTSIYSRLQNDVSWNLLKCGKCNVGLSYPQIAITIHFEKIIKTLFPNARVESRYIYEGFEIDVAIILPDIKDEKIFCIEYDSEFFHKKREVYDKSKNAKVVKKHSFVRFREENLRSLNDKNVAEITCPRYPRKNINMFDEAFKNCLQLFITFLEDFSTLNKDVLKSKIEKIHEISETISTISIENEIYRRIPEVPTEKQLSTVAQELAQQYSSKNDIDIEKISAHSNEFVLWECPINELHKSEPYSATVNSRTSEFLKAKNEGKTYNGCPYCAGKSAITSESLKTLYPEVAEYLEYGLELTPLKKEFDFNKLPVNSTMKLPFACRKCNYIQQRKDWRTIQGLTKIYNSIQNGSSKFKSLCPHCHEIALSKEAETYYDLLKNGKSSGDIAYIAKTSTKRVQKLIATYERLIING